MAGRDDYQDFKDELNNLKMNSKPVINFLTILAEEKVHNAALIVRAVEERIVEANSDHILPALYVLDSIVKNLRSSAYVQLFENQLPVLFSSAFNKVDERTRSAMFKLRQTWTPFFTNLCLYNLDTRAHDIDPAWPITAKVPDPPPFSPNIHLNPNFLQRNPALPMIPINQTLTDEVRQQLDTDSSTFRTRTVNQPPMAAAPPKIPELSSKGDAYRMIPIDLMSQIRQKTAQVLSTGTDGESQVKGKKRKKIGKKRRPSARLRRRVSAIQAAVAANNNQESSSEDSTEEEGIPNDDDDDDEDDDEPFVIKPSSALTNGIRVKSTVSVADSTSGGTDNDVEGLFGGTDKDYRDTDVATKSTATSLDADSIFEINSKCLLLAEQKYKSNELSSEEYQATLKLLQNILESEVQRLTIQPTTNSSLLNGNNNNNNPSASTQAHSVNTNTPASNPFQQQLLQFAQRHATHQQSSLSNFPNPPFPFPSFGDDAYRHVMQILATVGAPPSITSHYNFLPYVAPLPPAPPSLTLLQNQFASPSQSSSLQAPPHASSPPPGSQQIYSGRHSPSSKRSYDENGDHDNKRRYDPVTGRATRSRYADEENVAPVPTLIDANVNMLKKRYIGIVQQLYIGKFQCRLCGLRFSAKQKNLYNHHLDWHYWENRQEKEMSTQSSSALLQRSRHWYSSVQEWTEYEENIDEQMRAGSLMIQARHERQNSYAGGHTAESGVVSCPAASNGDIDDDRCYVCHDPFENFFDDNREEWHLRDAIRVDGKTYHQICYQDAKFEGTLDKLPLADTLSTDTSTKMMTDTIGTVSSDAATTSVTSDNGGDMAAEAPSSPEASTPTNYQSSMSFVELVEKIFKKEDIKPDESTEIIKEESVDTVPVFDERFPLAAVKFEPESSDVPNDTSIGTTTEVLPSSSD